MAYQNYPKKIKTSEEFIKESIVAKIINAQATRDDLFKSLNTPTEDMAKITNFQRFIVAFNSLFEDTKHNIARSLKIVNWDKKSEKYEKYLSERTMVYTKDNMKSGYSLYEEFQGDMVKVDLFKLLDEIGEGGESEDFGDEEYTEEEGEESG